MHTLLEQIRAQIGNVKEYVNKGHHHRAIVTELEKVEKRFSEYEEIAALASLAPASPVGAERFRSLVTYAVEHLPADDGRLVMKEWQRLLAEDTAQLAALTAQCAGLRKDAERYRYLHNRNHCIVYAKVPCEGWGYANMAHMRYDTPEELDAAIDGAIAAGNGEGV